MSYAIIKSIKIKNNKVFINSTDNNVYPHYYHEWECNSLTEILVKNGREALEVELVSCYEEGQFHAGVKNKYSKAALNLNFMPEYKQFNWRSCGIGKDYELRQENRKKPEFRELLKRALKEDYSHKCIVSKQWDGKEVFIKRVSKWRVSFCQERDKAKVFFHSDMADRLIKSLQTNEQFNIITL